MKKKILFLLLTIFMFTGIAYADTDVYMKMGMGETTTLNPNADAGTTGKTFTFSNTTEPSTTGSCYSLTSSGELSVGSGGVQYPEGCEVKTTAKSSDNTTIVNYTIDVTSKINIQKNEGTITCNGTDGRTYKSGWQPYETTSDPVVLRIKPTYTLRDVFPTSNIGLSGYNCTITKENSYFGGWYVDGEDGVIADATTPLNKVNWSSIHPHWTDTPTTAQSIEIEDPYGAGVIALKLGDENYSFKRLGVFFTPYYTTNQKVTWSSADSSIATVDADGKVTAVANGETTIKAVSEDGNHEATIKVIVNEKDENYFIFPSNPVLKADETLTFSLIGVGPVTFTRGTPTYTSSDETIASFEKDSTTGTTTAKIKAHKQGKVTITATVGEGENVQTATAILNVTDKDGHMIDDLDFFIEFEGGEGATGSMEPQAHYKNQKLIIKNQYKKEGYIFAHWKAYIEKADGTRVEWMDNGTQATFSETDPIPSIEMEEGSKLVLVAVWVTNPETGSLAPIAIGTLILLGGYLFFVKARNYNKIARI